MFGIEYQNVELPFVASTCPNVPVPLFESLNSPVRRSLSIVDEARYARPVAEKLPETKALVVVLLVVNRLVIVALVVVEFPTIRLVMVASVEKSEAIVPVVEKSVVLVALVRVALVIVAFVVVEFPTIRLVMVARVATRDEMKELVEVLLVDTRLVKKPLVELEFTTIELFVKSVSTVIALADAVFSVVWPETVTAEAEAFPNVV